MIYERDTRTNGGIDERVEIVSSPCYKRQGLGEHPFALYIKAEPIFPTELRYDVTGEGIVAVVRSVRQSMPRTNLNRVLSLDVVGIGRSRAEVIPESVCAEEERSQNGIGHCISDIGEAVPKTSHGHTLERASPGR